MASDTTTSFAECEKCTKIREPNAFPTSEHQHDNLIRCICWGRYFATQRARKPMDEPECMLCPGVLDSEDMRSSTDGEAYAQQLEDEEDDISQASTAVESKTNAETSTTTVSQGTAATNNAPRLCLRCGTPLVIEQGRKVVRCKVCKGTFCSECLGPERFQHLQHERNCHYDWCDTPAEPNWFRAVRRSFGGLKDFLGRR